MFARRRMRQLSHKIDYREQLIRTINREMATTTSAARRAYHAARLQRHYSDVESFYLEGESLLQLAIEAPNEYWQHREQQRHLNGKLNPCSERAHIGYEMRFCPQCVAAELKTLAAAKS